MSSTLKSLRALSDPTRLRIVALLERDELSVNELQEITRLGQSRISTHLGLLQDSELVQSRRDGKRTFYKLDPDADGAAREFIQLAIRGAKELPEHARRPNQSQARAQPPPRAGAGLFQPDCRAVRPRLWPGPFVAGVRAFAVAHPAAAGRGRPRRGRRPVERTARAPLQKGHRRGQLGKDRRLRRGQGEEERAEKSGVPPWRFAEPAD